MITAIVIVGIIVLILVHELGHFVAAKMFGVKVEEFGLGYPPRIAQIKKGETTYSINALPLGGFVKILGEDGEKNDPRSFAVQAAWKRAVMLLAGICMNIIAGWIFFSGVYMVGSPLRMIVTDVRENTPAAAAGIRAGDMILSAKTNFVRLGENPKSEEFIRAMKEAAGTVVTLEIAHEGKQETVSLTPRANPPEGEGSLGVVLTDSGLARQGFFTALWNGLLETGIVISMTVLGFVHLIANLFVPGTLDGLAGPIGIVKIAADTGKFGLVYVFQIIGFISVNLAVLNLIPFPALDGGRVLFLFIEKIRRKPMPQKIEYTINAIGFFALIALMIVVTAKDVLKLIH